MTEIEEESLSVKQVSFSMVKHVGVNNSTRPSATHEIDAVVTMMLEAIYHFKKPFLLNEMLWWHRALFSDGYSGFYRIKVGVLRYDNRGLCKSSLEAMVESKCILSRQVLIC